MDEWTVPPMSDDLIAAADSGPCPGLRALFRLSGGGRDPERGRAVHLGCNVENVAYPEGTCAEAGAIAAMIAAGDTASPRSP
jgi:cytidine deaminase